MQKEINKEHGSMNSVRLLTVLNSLGWGFIERIAAAISYLQRLRVQWIKMVCMTSCVADMQGSYLETVVGNKIFYCRGNACRA